MDMHTCDNPLLKFLSLQMRAGTQTLIQALQALPWMASDDDEGPGDLQSEPESEEERPGCKLQSPSFSAVPPR